FLLILLHPLAGQDSLTLITVTAPTWAADQDGRALNTINQKELASTYFGQEPALLLERKPSVTAFTDAGSPFGYAYCRLRGIDQTRLNFTIDGVPLNEPEDQGFYFNNYVDLLSSIRAVQLQPGVNVGVNGVAAYAGSVQLLSPSIGGAAFTEVSAGYGSFGSYRLSAATRQALGAKQDWQVYARASRLGANGFKEHSNHEGTSAFLQLGRAGKQHLFKFTAFGGNQQNQMAWLGVTDSLLQLNPRANGNDVQELDNFTTTLSKAQYTWLPSDQLQWSTSLYHGYQRGNYDFDLNNFLAFDLGEGLYNYAFRYHNVGILSNLAYEQDNWKFHTGGHGQTYVRRHLGSQEGIGELYTNHGKKRELSSFASLAHESSTLHLRAAAQLRHVQFSYDGQVPLDAQRYTFLNYELSAALPLQSGTLYYRLGSTGREPTRNDLFGGNDDLLADADGQALTFVTTPETVFDQEFGLRGKGKNLNYQFNAFYLRFQDEIVLSGAFGPNGLPLRSSVAKSYRLGLEWSLEYQPNQRLTLYQDGALSEHSIQQDGASFAPVLSPPVLINQGAAYTLGSWTFGLDTRYQSASFIDFANEHKIDAFVTIDARIQWMRQRWTVSAFVFNLTDAAYATNGQLDVNGLPTFHRRAGINGWLRLQYRW
ncbi:MAG: TonB-dependent receptor plug domain-containing protein, partial [Bacteroidota bacterium]